MLRRLLIGFAVALLAIAWTLPLQATPSAEPSAQPPALTIDLLRERVQAPIQQEGTRVIDLRQLTIDLETDDELRNEFYQSLRQQQTKAPVGLDISESVVLGKLAASRMGQVVPLQSPSLPPSLTDEEQQQIQRDRRRLSQLSQLSQSLLIKPVETSPEVILFPGALRAQNARFTGPVDLSKTFFLGTIQAQGAIAEQSFSATEARFGRPVDLTQAKFEDAVRWQGAVFFDQATFSRASFAGETTFTGSEFRGDASFSQSRFQQDANFSRATWQAADFAQSYWEAAALFIKSRVTQTLFLPDAVFNERPSFREAQFNQPVNLRGASILNQADFGDATFGPEAYLNVSGLEFSASLAKILGNPGEIGAALSVSTLQGNETLLRNLIRNFRLQEQIPDANQLQYTTETLRQALLYSQLTDLNVNSATVAQLVAAGFTAEQAQAIAARRSDTPFQRLSDLLQLDEIDLAFYIKVSDSLVAVSPQSVKQQVIDGFYWLGLSLLLLLTRYGTDLWLIFGIGFVAVAYFSLLFWLVDRFRRLPIPSPRPTQTEVYCILCSSALLAASGVNLIVQSSDHPLWSLLCLGLVIGPVPLALAVQLYAQSRQHPLINQSYFVEDGSSRQFQLLIGRLPIIPRFTFFRDRYEPILWERRWNWLNYLDLSLLNFIKFGFNDIRLRDRAVPGLVTALVWYQWTLGLLYVALLLWTLSRTIPGLNLLLYF
ncbi:MAG: pentapeptide repeat-containing protein [Elainellaceae cyanobacterium]